LDLLAQLTIYIGLALPILGSILNIVLRLMKKEFVTFTRRLNILVMFSMLLNICGMLFGTIYASNMDFKIYIFEEKVLNLDLNVFPLFSYHTLLAFLFLLLISNTMSKVENSLVVLIGVIIFIVAMGGQFLVAVIDLIFPPKLQELVPYIDAFRTLILNIGQVLADPQRIEAEQALASLGNMSDKVDEIGEGYALRKSIGQGIDFGLSAVVIALGMLTFLIGTGIPPGLVILFFGTLSIAFATFSGLFGPFYGIAGAAKDFSLRQGNYRGASIYKTIEQLFAIPFMAASAGFMLLDLPPVDAETLDDFKDEMQDQLTEISDNINSLLGKDQGAIPRKTRKLIESLMESTTQSLGTLDFRNIREETAREFALTYYQHEFSWKPWKRKEAVEEFAVSNNFDVQTGEDTLRLIGYKILAGQMDDDMVSNVMISAAMKGVIMMEQKYQELFEDVELGQTCTGLAFGARQFLHDHYIVRSQSQSAFGVLKNLFLGIFAIPMVLAISFYKYTNRFFDTLGENFWNQRIVETSKLRYGEISTALLLLPSKIREFRTRGPKTDKEKEQRNWEIRRKLRRVISMIWEVLVFPIVILMGISKWLWKRLSKQERGVREMFEEAIAHAALVSMYDELYKKLVMQDHVTTGY
jgi:hypothetical protein